MIFYRFEPLDILYKTKKSESVCVLCVCVLYKKCSLYKEIYDTLDISLTAWVNQLSINFGKDDE